MIKAKVINDNIEDLSDITLDDFSQFEEKMAKIKNINQIIKDIDKSDIKIVISKLDFADKKISARKVKKIFSEVLKKMIEETQP